MKATANPICLIYRVQFRFCILHLFFRLDEEELEDGTSTILSIFGVLNELAIWPCLTLNSVTFYLSCRSDCLLISAYSSVSLSPRSVCLCLSICLSLSACLCLCVSLFLCLSVCLSLLLPLPLWLSLPLLLLSTFCYRLKHFKTGLPVLTSAMSGVK